MMLERNVSAEFNWPVNPTLRFPNVNSLRKTKSSRNTSFLGTGLARLNPHRRREDQDRTIRGRARVAAVVVEEGGAGEVEAVDPVEEAGVEVGTPVTGRSKTRTKLRGAITTGSEATTRRWRGEGRHRRSISLGYGVFTPVFWRAIKTGT